MVYTVYQFESQQKSGQTCLLKIPRKSIALIHYELEYYEGSFVAPFSSPSCALFCRCLFGDSLGTAYSRREQEGGETRVTDGEETDRLQHVLYIILL